MEETAGRQRVTYIDSARGIAMLLVIVGHTVDNEWIKGLIYSFHIPLFFICSGLTYCFSADGSAWLANAGKGFRRLLCPALVFYLITAILSVWLEGGFAAMQDLLQFVRERILALLWFSGNDVRIGDRFIGAVGVIWFLMALFLARCLWDLMHLYTPKWQGLFSFAATVSGILMGRVMWMPFSFDVALAGIGFLQAGYWMRGRGTPSFGLPSPLTGAFLSGTVWLALFCVPVAAGCGWFDMAMRKFPLFPLCYLSAAAGTVFVFCIAAGAERWQYGCRVLAFIGRNSNILLFVHYMAYLLYLLYAAHIQHEAARCSLRLVAELTIFAVVTAVLERRKKVHAIQ